MIKMPNVDLLFADRKKLAAAALVFCLAVYADAALLIKGQVKGTAAVKQKIAKTRAEIDNISRDITLMNQNAGNSRTISLLGESYIPELLRHVSAVASSHEVKILQITPLKSKEAKSLQTQRYLGLVIKLDLTAGYHDLGRFINELGRGEHPLFAEELKITQGPDFMRQRVSLNLRTYVKK